jgi:hypothetical protein
MDDQRTDRKVSQGMTEMPEERRHSVIRFDRKTVLIIIAITVGYALGYFAGRHDGEVRMMQRWLEKTAPPSMKK